MPDLLKDLRESMGGGTTTPSAVPNVGLGETYPWREGGVPDEVEEDEGGLPGDPNAPTVIAIGGIGSTPRSEFFKVVQAVAPGAIPIHLKGQGMKDTMKRLRSQLTKLSEEGKRYVVVGHSLGASMASLLEDETRLNPNPNASFLYLDPPYNPPWKHAPFSGAMSPVVDAINRSSAGGISLNPGTIDWTAGRTIMYGPGPAAQHTPWDHPDAPGNAERITSVQDRLRSLLSPAPARATPASPTFIRPTAIPSRAATPP